MTGTSPDSGIEYDMTALEVLSDLEVPTTTISGPAPDLEVWMWGRLDDNVLAIAGDAANATQSATSRMRAAVVESTQ